MNLISKISLSSLNRNLKALLPEIQEAFVKSIQRNAPKSIKEAILSGMSPVGGKGRFERYSKSYERAIRRGSVGSDKKVRPVNLKVSGEMIKAIKARVRHGKCEVYVQHDLAVIHNTKGAGKSKVIRRILPTNKGEKFSTALMSWLKKEAINAAKKVIQKRFSKVH